MRNGACQVCELYSASDEVVVLANFPEHQQMLDCERFGGPISGKS